MRYIDPEVLDEKATEWVNKVVPEMYKALDRAGITYSEDMLCESLSDGFKAGYVTHAEEIAKDYSDHKPKSGGDK